MRANWQSKNHPFFLMKKMGSLYKKKKWAPDGRTMGITKISRISPINSKKVQKNAPIGQKCVCFFFKAENGLMVGAMKSAFFLMGVLKKKKGSAHFLEIGILALSSYIAYWGLRGLIKKRKMVTRHLVFDKYS